MSLITDGIEQVRAFQLPVGIWPDGGCFDCPRAALVRWRSNWTDKLYQVYVNGRLAAATVDIAQRQLVVHLPGSFSTAVRIEVFAVEPRFAHIDFGGELPQTTNSGRIKLRILKSQQLPLEATIQIYSDDGTGTVDYDKPVNVEPIRIWPSFYDKAG